MIQNTELETCLYCEHGRFLERSKLIGDGVVKEIWSCVECVCECTSGFGCGFTATLVTRIA